MFLKFYSNSETDKFIILTENKGKAGIYQWTHKESGKSYIGSSVDLSKRFRVYYSPLSLERADNYISRALICHNHSAFSLTILEYIDISNLSIDLTRQLMLEREQHYIDTLSPEYNILPTAGNSLGYKHTKETIAKISGQNHPLFGKSHTAETIAKMSAAKSGKNHPFFGKTGENNPMGGKIHKEETITRMSLAKGGSIIYVYNADKSTLDNSFPSARKAAKHFKCDKSTISRYIKSGKLFKGEYILSITAPK